MYKRVFLNKPHYHTIASALVECTRDSTRFILTDCNKIVELDFDDYSSDSAQNSLYKARLLHQLMGEFLEALEKKNAKKWKW